MEEDELTHELKWTYDISENMGRAIGIGFCYVKCTISSEIYLYINVWKWNIAIGRIWK